MTVTVNVKIPYNVPLAKLPWRSYPQALADLVKSGATPRIVETISAKERHLD